MHSIEKEIEKIQKSLDRYIGIYEKKWQKCIDKGCAWTDEEQRQHYSKEKRNIWFEASMARHNVEDSESRLANAEKRLLKAQKEFGIIKDEIEEQERIESKETSWITFMNKTEEERKAEYEAWLAKFKAECLEDGIVIDTADATEVIGTTKSGRHFWLYINNGWTKRSFYCYTLRIEGETYFTSGTFSRAYAYLMK